MKKRAPWQTTATVFISLLLLFLVHQLIFSSIWSPWPPPPLPETQKPEQKQVQQTQEIKCDQSHHNYDLCSLNGKTVINPTVSTVSLVDPTESIQPQSIKIRPYPRKWEKNTTMSRIKEVTLLTTTTSTKCDVHHNSPALVFSTGGYTGSVFHDFNEGFVPLFVTVRTVFPNHEHPVLVIANCRQWWVEKYSEIIQQFSPYPIVNLDTETATHCFPSASVGLVTHGFMSINQTLLPNHDTFRDFRALLGNAYLHTKNHLSQQSFSKPRLVLVSRTGARAIRNQAEVIKLAEQSGFEVKIFEPTTTTPMSSAYGLINSSHAMLGVHGAGLTHFLFLRPGSVFIQVVPIGIEWLSETCFGKAAKEFGTEYEEYRIRKEESSLVEKYGVDHLVLKDGEKAFWRRPFGEFKEIYLEGQDVILDLDRIGKYLKRAYGKAKDFMDREG